MITLLEAKDYLRVDSTFEDDLIEGMLASAQTLCRDVARLTAEKWDAIAAATEESDVVEINGSEYTAAEQMQMRNILRIASLYALGYLYEHREEADHHDLVLTLRNLLFSIREGVL